MQAPIFIRALSDGRRRPESGMENVLFFSVNTIIQIMYATGLMVSPSPRLVSQKRTTEKDTST